MQVPSLQLASAASVEFSCVSPLILAVPVTAIFLPVSKPVTAAGCHFGLGIPIPSRIHPKIERAIKKLFSDGHYAEAIFAAYKTVDKLVQKRPGCMDTSRKNLMFKVFNKDKSILALNDGVIISDKDEQEGFMHKFAGASQGISNPKAHDNAIQKSAEVTLQYLGLANLLCRTVDRAKKCKGHPR